MGHDEKVVRPLVMALVRRPTRETARELAFRQLAAERDAVTAARLRHDLTPRGEA